MPERAERKAFAEGLTRLNQNVVRMAELSQESVRKAVDSLLHRNPEESRAVYALDREIYRLQREIERECTDLIALHAPVAKDLRTVTTSLKISTDLDRIGRGARNIAELALELADLDPVPPRKLDKLGRNADLAIHMVDQAVRAFVERDDRAVREMDKFDDAVDALHKEIFNDLVRGLKDRSLRPEVGARYVLVNRHIERIADHAVNVADRVVYMVSGEPPAHVEAPPPSAQSRLDEAPDDVPPASGPGAG